METFELNYYSELLPNDLEIPYFPVSSWNRLLLEYIYWQIVRKEKVSMNNNCSESS